MTAILIVEDNALIRMATKFLFKSFDCEVDFANTGKEALRCLEKRHYDIVFLDLGLPDMSGFELAKKIRSVKKQENLRLIALTAQASESKHECQAVGVREFYTKPLRESDIVAVLSKAYRR
ncbi:MAG TPA: response regulator [Gammaproteobacteria bacterium]|nr:response regulator [Gammaproteobacteria bacterium]